MKQALAPTKKVTVILLDRKELCLNVEVKAKGQDLYNLVCNHIGLRETEYFGLATLTDGEFRFLELDSKLSKQAPKAWKAANGCNKDGVPLLKVFFRVQFYVDNIMLMRERATRQQYYLQLKENLITYGQPSCNSERCFLLASFAMQADLGNHSTGAGDYFDPREYFPAWAIEKHGRDYIVSNMPSMHCDLHGMPKTEAICKFISEASTSPAAHNLHFYRLKKRKNDAVAIIWVGVCSRGIEIYEEERDHFRTLVISVPWAKIGKLEFDKKKFGIRVLPPDGNKFAYFAASDDQSRHLLELCQDTHQFQLFIQPKLHEIQHFEAEDQRRYKESYIYSSQLDLARQRSAIAQSTLSLYKYTLADKDPRFSVISNTSSNTTSGIASDKVMNSCDESEDDKSCQIRMECPKTLNLDQNVDDLDVSLDSASGMSVTVKNNATKRPVGKLVSDNDSGKGHSAPVSPESSCANVTTLGQNTEMMTSLGSSNRSTPCQSRVSTPSTVTTQTMAEIHIQNGHSNTNSIQSEINIGANTDNGNSPSAIVMKVNTQRDISRPTMSPKQLSSSSASSNEFGARAPPQTITINDYGKVSGLDYPVQGNCSLAIPVTSQVPSANQYSVPSTCDSNMWYSQDLRLQQRMNLQDSRTFSSSTPALTRLPGSPVIHTSPQFGYINMQNPAQIPSQKPTTALNKSQRGGQRRPHTLDNCYIPPHIVHSYNKNNNRHCVRPTMTVHSRPVVTKHFATGPTEPPLPPRQYAVPVVNQYPSGIANTPMDTKSPYNIPYIQSYSATQYLQGRVQTSNPYSLQYPMPNNYSASNLGHLANPNLPTTPYVSMGNNTSGDDENLYVNFALDTKYTTRGQHLQQPYGANQPYSANRMPRGPLAGNPVGVYGGRYASSNTSNTNASSNQLLPPPPPPPCTSTDNSLRQLSDSKINLDSSLNLDPSLDSVLHPEIAEIRGHIKDLSSLPMMSALCNDSSLIPTKDNSSNCSCHGSVEVLDKPCHAGCYRTAAPPTSYPVVPTDPKRLSAPYSLNSPANPVSPPRSPSRPLSWHLPAGNFNIHGTYMQGLPNPPYQAPPQYNYQMNPTYALPNQMMLTSFTGGSPRQQHHSSGDSHYGQLIPLKLSSGGHSSQSSDTVQHKSALGLA